MCPRDVLHQRQPQPEPAAGSPRRRARSGRRAARRRAGSSPDPVVDDRGGHPAVVGGHDPDRAPGRRRPTCPTALSTSAVSGPPQRRYGAPDGAGLRRLDVAARPPGLLRVRGHAADHLAWPPRPRSTRVSDRRPVLDLGRDQQILDHLAERPGVRDQLVELAGEPVSAGSAPGAAGQQLGAGVQHGQRRAQLVRGVGDEPALQGQRGGQRRHRPPRQQYGGRPARRPARPARPAAARRRVVRCRRRSGARSAATAQRLPSAPSATSTRTGWPSAVSVSYRPGSPADRAVQHRTSPGEALRVTSIGPPGAGRTRARTCPGGGRPRPRPSRATWPSSASSARDCSRLASTNISAADQQQDQPDRAGGLQARCVAGRGAAGPRPRLSAGSRRSQPVAQTVHRMDGVPAQLAAQVVDAGVDRAGGVGAVEGLAGAARRG